MKVTVDKEKLAYGLEKGVPKADLPFLRGADSEELLRIVPCGLVSTAISEYLKNEGIPNYLTIVEPKFWFDPGMRHVLPVIADDSLEDRTVVDASYSQFFAYVGINREHEVHIGEDLFPKEKIIDFEDEKVEEVIAKLVDHAEDFQKINKYPEGLWRNLGHGPLCKASRSAIQAVFREIWGYPQNRSIWTPPERVVADGRAVSEPIPPGAVILS